MFSWSWASLWRRHLNQYISICCEHIYAKINHPTVMKNVLKVYKLIKAMNIKEVCKKINNLTSYTAFLEIKIKFSYRFFYDVTLTPTKILDFRIRAHFKLWHSITYMVKNIIFFILRLLFLSFHLMYYSWASLLSDNVQNSFRKCGNALI